jgi:hypothetical protein
VIEEEGLVAKAARKGSELKGALSQFVDKYEHVTDVRGRGLMLALVLDQPAKPLVDMLEEIGLLTLATAENVVRLLPPLNVKDGEIDEAVDMLNDCLAEWHGVSEDETAEEAEETAAEAEAAPVAAAAGPETPAPEEGAEKGQALAVAEAGEADGGSADVEPEPATEAAPAADEPSADAETAAKPAES